jgi:uncharacterized membrane protein
MEKERYHFLDGLRGAAMLLGLVLHGVLSFAGIPIWPAEDVRSAPEVIYPVIDWIHGFRMPLFFLVSGFFTALMWKKRGMGGLVKQRVLRIGVPLFAGVVLVFPAMIALGIWGGQVKAERGEVVRVGGSDLFEMVIKGDVEKVRFLLEKGGDANEKDQNGTPLLHVASIADNAEMVAGLLEEGAELEGRGAGGGTALTTACFFGREEAALVLLKAGAEVSAEDWRGTSVMEATTTDFEIVKAIGGVFQIAVEESHREARERLVVALAERGADSREGSGLGWYRKGMDFPVFHHLWFLYDLLWLLVIFVPVAAVFGRLGWRLPDFLIAVPGCLLWLVPLTWWMQTLMPGQFGPGTSIGIFPWPQKLGYYAVFFFFGALSFGRGFWEKKVGRIWWGWLLVSVPLFWWGRDLIKEDVVWGSLLASGFAWVTIVGMMGVFRRFLNEGRPVVRYFSDSSYWLYVAHLPLMIAVQILISGWEAPLLLKLVIVITSVTAILLVIYEFAIRYTWVGAVMNGRKVRVSPPPLPRENESD